MDRDNPTYRERKLAWELVNSPAWQEYLKPMLERKAYHHQRQPVGGLDDAFKVAQAHAEMDSYRRLLATVEQKASAFSGQGRAGAAVGLLQGNKQGTHNPLGEHG